MTGGSGGERSGPAPGPQGSGQAAAPAGAATGAVTDRGAGTGGDRDVDAPDQAAPGDEPAGPPGDEPHREGVERVPPPPGDERATRRQRPLASVAMRRLWVSGAALIALQFAGLVAWSWHLWTRFDLTADMATFSQAFQQIGTGHLDPYETTFVFGYPHWGYSFYQSHFELLMWPLALLYTVTRTTFTLLIVQDLALAGSGALVFRWACEILDRQWPAERRGRVMVGAGVLAVIVANPWTYWVASFDWHFQPIATFFVVAAARDVWAGGRRAWIWVVLVLLCGDVAATYVLALGLAALIAGRATRRWGVAMIAAGVVWLGVVSLAGAGKGSSLNAGYGYLAGHPVSDGIGGMVAIVVGMLLHPSHPWDTLRSRWWDAGQYLAGAGTIGVLSPIGAALTLVVLVPNTLYSNGIFISHIAAFQNFAAVMAVCAGAVPVLVWAARRRSRLVWWACGLLAVAGLVQALVVSVRTTPQARTTFARVGPATASTLATVAARVPPDAEVVVSQGVMGRFGGRRWIYPFDMLFPAGVSVPVHGGEVYFVIVPNAGIEIGTPADAAATIGYLRRLGARTVVDADGVVAMTWHRPPGTHALILPGAAAAASG